MKKLLALSVLLASLGAHAAVTHTPFVLGAVNDASGNLLDGTLVMVADLDGSGWDYLNDDNGPADTWLWDSNDLLMDRTDVNAGNAVPAQSNYIPGPEYDAGVDHYYIVWFDTPFVPGAAGPGHGIAYGAYDVGTVGVDPGTYTPVITSAGNATMTTEAIPEPSTVVLSLLGLALVARRRNNR